METVGAAIRQSPQPLLPLSPPPSVAVISAIYRWQQLVTIASVSRHAHGYHKRGQAMSLCESRTKESLYTKIHKQIGVVKVQGVGRRDTPVNTTKKKLLTMWSLT